MMTPDEYQRNAMRTLCDQHAAERRIVSREAVQLLHAVIGLQGEAGELAALLQKWLWYGQEFPREQLAERIKDEAGDVLWYVAELLDACGLSLQDVLEANIRKLRQRYPEKWDATKADHRNRDLVAERDAVVRRNMQSLAAQDTHPKFGRTGLDNNFEQDGHGFGHADRGDTCDLGYHEFTLRQTPAGSGSVCVRCGIAEPE